MRTIILVIGAMLAFTASADQTIQMNNGMVCFQNPSGHIYGCHGGAPNRDAGFNDVRSGRRYESTGGRRAIDTRTGQTFDEPDYSNNLDYADDYE